MMKHFFCVSTLVLCITSAAFATTLGWEYGPVANELKLVEHGGDFPVELYGAPGYVGGPFIRTDLPWDKTFYSASLTFAEHDATKKGAPDVAMQNYLFYLHSDLNYKILDERIYAGAGLEFIMNFRTFSGGWSEYTYYPGTDFFFYITTGYIQAIGPVEIGARILFRLIPTSIESNFGTGEVSLSLGYRLKAKKNAPIPAAEDTASPAESAPAEITDTP